MRTPLITEKDAHELNKSVRSSIDGRLFICCNYSPTVNCAISEDGLYFTAFQDLYKFAYDTSCIIKNYYRFLSLEDRKKFDILQRCLDDIQLLRSVQSHNQNEKNGRIEQRRLQQYEHWVEKVLQKKAPQTQEDFAALNQKLKNIAENLLGQLRKFITHISNSSNKTESIQTWIDLTLFWYSTNTKREIYRGQLENEYILRTRAANGAGIDDYHKPFILRRKIKNWIEAALYAPINKELENVEDKLNQISKVLDNPSVLQSTLDKMSEEQSTVFQQYLQEQKKQLEQKKASIRQNRKDLKEKIEKKGNVLDYFYSQLKDQLQDMVNKLDGSDPDYSLLPQDLMQEHIKEFFFDVSSPDGDF